MNRYTRRAVERLRPSEYNLIQYLHFLGTVGATDDDIIRAVRYADRYRSLDELKRRIVNGIRELGYTDDEQDTLSFLKIRIPSIGEVVQKAAGYIAGRIGGEKARKVVEQKVADINREVTKVTEHPVGQAIIAGGLIAMTGGLGAGSLAAKIGGVISKGASTVAAGAKALAGGAAKLGVAAWKGAGALGKMAIAGAKKGYEAVAGLFRRKDEGPAAGVGGVPTPFTAGEGIPPAGIPGPPVEYVPPAPVPAPVPAPQPRVVDLRGAVAHRTNAEKLPVLAMLTIASLLA